MTLFHGHIEVIMDIDFCKPQLHGFYQYMLAPQNNKPSTTTKTLQDQQLKKAVCLTRKTYQTTWRMCGNAAATP